MKNQRSTTLVFWSECRDLNPGPLPPQGSALPGCATSRGFIVAQDILYPMSVDIAMIHGQIPGKQMIHGRRSRSAALPHLGAQRFSCLESRNAAGRNVNHFSGLRIPSLPRRPFTDVKVAESDQLDLFSSRQRVRNDLKDRVHHYGTVFLREVGPFRNDLY